MSQVPMHIIRWEGDDDNNVLVYRSRITDFNTGSVLIVNESQEALVYQNGIAERYGHGQHQLPTLNTPVTRGFWASFFSRRPDAARDGSTPYSCDVYFVNRVADLSLLWGTPSRITCEDPKYHVFVHVGANGSTKVRVKDAMRFVISTVGQLPEYSFERLKSTIKQELVQIVVSLISQEIQQMETSVLELQGRLLPLSDRIQEQLNLRLEDMGLEATHFAIQTLEPEQKDLAELEKLRNERLRELQAIDLEATRVSRLTREKAAAEADARRMGGYTYQEERQFDVLEKAVSNEGISGTVMGATVGAGLGATLGAGLGATVRQAAQPAGAGVCPRCGAVAGTGRFCAGCGQPLTPPKRFCAECGTELPEGARFCGNCGAPTAPQERQCPQCHATVPENVRFCPQCGAKQA